MDEKQKGVDSPQENWSRFPNCILDNLDRFTGNELKVLAFMIRKTLGWQAKANKMFAAEYVGKKLGMSEKTARTAIDGLEQSGVVKHIGASGKAGVKMYEVLWKRPVKVTDRQKPVRPVKFTADARQDLPAVLDTRVIETKEAAAAEDWFIQSKQVKTESKKPKKSNLLIIEEIQPLMDILTKNGTALSTVSNNTRRMMQNAVEQHGINLCKLALQGRINQAKKQDKPLFLNSFFDPDRSEWFGDCAKIGETMADPNHGYKSQIPAELADEYENAGRVAI